MMRAQSIIGAAEARSTLGALLERVGLGEEVVITRRGKPVARLTPFVGRRGPAIARAAAERMRARAQSLKDLEFNWEDSKADQDEGRP